MKFNAACLQLTSNNIPKENLETVLNQSEKAFQEGAQFILTPENTFLLTLDHKELIDKAEDIEEGNQIKEIRKFSKSKKIWFLIGGTPIKISKGVANRSILINPEGEISCYYDKIHMFDVNLPNGEVYKESDKFISGKDLVTADLPWGKIGLSICYDLRFSNHYRSLVKQGSIFLTVPSAFTKNTGTRHWHTLLKARAIENFSYVLAPAQSGKHYNGRETFGHSIIISPDGNILKEKESGVGYIVSEIETDLVKDLRSQIPSLSTD